MVTYYLLIMTTTTNKTNRPMSPTMSRCLDDLRKDVSSWTMHQTRTLIALRDRGLIGLKLSTITSNTSRMGFYGRTVRQTGIVAVEVI
jgi:hypothetical protein